MTRQKLFKFSIISLVIGLILLAISYFFFHFVTDTGITLTWHPEAGKPYVSEMLGDLSVLFLFSSAVSAIAALVFTEKDSKND